LPENPNGSGISLGHPIGATGCTLTVKGPEDRGDLLVS
jgi:acetyl-CoA acetyltransferase